MLGCLAMRQVTKIETFDGVLHDNVKEARKHLEVQYADVLCPLAHKITAAEKYSKICDLVDANLAEFAKLIKIKEDMALQPEDE